jgi:5-methylcytosine-specific restriction endonuclease McrA
VYFDFVGFVDAPGLLQTFDSAIADHIIAARKHIAQHGGDPSLFFDENNLQGVCKACHDAKTAKECGGAGGAGQ